MEFFECAAKRESCRSYQPDRPVEPEKLQNMLACACSAPSACNSQPWHFYVVQGQETGKVVPCLQSNGLNGFADQAPAFVVMTEELAALSPKLGKGVDPQASAQMDLGIAAAHLALAATAQGLSTCIMGWFQEERLKEELAIPCHSRIRLVVAVGYAAAEPLRPKKRRPMEQSVTFCKA